MVKELMENNKLILDSSILKYYFDLILTLEQQRSKLGKDILLLITDLFRHKELLMVPQVFAELYSLLKTDSKNNNELKSWLMQLLMYFKKFKERYIKKEDIIKDKEFLDYGFTDIALKKLLKREKSILLTNDWALRNICREKELKSYHIEELIELYKY